MTSVALRRALSLPVCASTSIVRFDSPIACNLPCRRDLLRTRIAVLDILSGLEAGDSWLTVRAAATPQHV